MNQAVRLLQCSGQEARWSKFVGCALYMSAQGPCEAPYTIQVDSFIGVHDASVVAITWPQKIISAAMAMQLHSPGCCKQQRAAATSVQLRREPVDGCWRRPPCWIHHGFVALKALPVCGVTPTVERNEVN